jgi:hypothetical protein
LCISTWYLPITDSKEIATKAYDANNQIIVFSERNRIEKVMTLVSSLCMIKVHFFSEKKEKHPIIKQIMFKLFLNPMYKNIAIRGL